MHFFDAFLGLGRTNLADPGFPLDERQCLDFIGNYDVDQALVFSYISRDCDPELGSIEISRIKSPKLHKAWGIETSCALKETPGEFVARALRHKARAFMVNPRDCRIRMARNPRLLAVARILEERRIPLLAVYRDINGGEDLIDWYDLADFCRMFPRLPVLAWECRSRRNRPLFDALSETANLKLSVSMVWQNEMIASIAETFGAARLVFSMGLPMLAPGSFQMAVSYADISGADKEAIAHGNVEAILEEAEYES